MLEYWQYPTTIKLGWYWEGIHNISLLITSSMMKEGSSFILDALLTFQELGSILAYLATKYMCACFFSRSTSTMGAFYLLSLVLLACLTSSHRLFTQFSFVSSKMLLGIISSNVSKGLWDSVIISWIGSFLGIFVGVSIMMTCLEVLFRLLRLFICCVYSILVSLVGTRFPCPHWVLVHSLVG